MRRPPVPDTPSPPPDALPRLEPVRAPRSAVRSRVSRAAAAGLVVGAVALVAIAFAAVPGRQLVPITPPASASAPPSAVATALTAVVPDSIRSGTIGRVTRSFTLLESDVAVEAGQLIHVVSGPVERRGRSAYRVQYWGDLTTGLRPDTIFDWADAAELETSIGPYDSACPGEPQHARDIAALQPFERLACFGKRTLTLAPVTPRDYRVGGFAGAPAWLAASSTVWLTDDGRPDFPTAIPFHVDPAIAIKLSASRWYEVSGRFDDTAAAECTGRAPAVLYPDERPASLPPEMPDEQVLWCRQQFVVEAARVVEAPATVLRGTWRRLATAPIAGKAEYAAAWTGQELVVWGGRSGDPDAGAAYDPAADRWRMIAPAPIAARLSPVVVWTGREMVVLGGWAGSSLWADGAAYDPETDRWRRLSRSPLAVAPARAIWTGKEVLVVTGTPAAAAWNPATDRWRTLAVPPIAAGSLELVATDDGPVVLGFGEGAGEPIIAALMPARATASWQRIASPPYDSLMMGAKATAVDGRIVFGATRYESATDTWHPIATDDCAWQIPSEGDWTGRFLINQREAFDPVVGRCLQLPPAPPRVLEGTDTATHESATPIWTGEEYIVWSGTLGLDGVSIPNDGVAFRPSSP